MPSENELRSKKVRKSSFQKSPRVKPTAVKQEKPTSPPLVPATKVFQDLPDDDEEKSGFKESLAGALIGLCVGSFLCWLGVEFSWRGAAHSTGPHYFSGEIVVFCTIAGAIIGYLSTRSPRDFRDPFGWWW